MTREEVLLDTRTKLQTIGLPKLKEEVGKYFFEMDNVVEALYVALTSGFNIILYGPGGFGKTQVVKKFLEIAGLASSTIVGYEDMEVDGLLGVVDIKKLTEEATYEIKFERSVFANPGILILEEFLDARPSTAAALKDILTEGGYRRGSYFVESLISSVIICTNKSPDEVSTNLSSAAFYKERFPIVIHVNWSSFDAATYLRFLYHIKPEQSKQFNEQYQVIAELASRTSLKGSIVSPRIAKYASDLVDLHKDLFCLNNLYGLDTSAINEVVMLCRGKTEKQQLEGISYRISEFIKTITGQESYSNAFITDSIAKLDYLSESLTKLPIVNSDNFSTIVKLRATCSETREMLNKKLAVHLTDSSRKQIDLLFKL